VRSVPTAWLVTVLLVVLAGCGRSSAPPQDELDPLARRGRQLYQSQNCVTCHSVDGSPRIGPSWAGIWGQPVQLADGSTVTVDAAYIAESIHDPQAKLVEGFSVRMPAYALPDDDVAALTAYIETLAEKP
jgi:cytochrome c oxidase subunit II